MSALSQIAKDSFCLLAVDALQGGRWLSTLRPPVPRNFAESPETWTVFLQKLSEIALDDCEINLKLVPLQTSRAAVFWGIYFSSDNTSLVINSGTLTDNPLVVVLTPSVNEPVSIVIKRVGNSVEVFSNEVSKGKRSGNAIDLSTAELGNAISEFNGYLLNASLINLTTGETVWQAVYSDLYKIIPWPSAPSGSGSGTWEERTGLLTFNNIITTGGVFRAADDAKIAGISTPLDFRGNTKSKTFIARAFCPAHDPASEKLYIHPFFVQGAIQQGTSFYTFQFSLWEDRRSGRTTQLFPTISIGTDSPGATVTGAEIYLDQWHTYAMVIDYNGGNCYIRAFVDGVLLRERIISGTPVWYTPAATTTQETTVGIRRDPTYAYYAGSLTRISAALIFDRALTQPEIAAISNKL